MRLSTVVIAAMVTVGAIAIVRGVRGDDRNPGATTAHPPGWQLHIAKPGEEFRPRGRYSDSRTSCLLDLASDARVQPDGTKLACIRIDRKDGR